MGFYVNPPNEDKEQFLDREGLLVEKLDYSKVPSSMVPIILMDNGAFKAAGIAYSEKEFKAFTDKSDPRPKKIFLVKKAALKEINCDFPGAN